MHPSYPLLVKSLSIPLKEMGISLEKTPILGEIFLMLSGSIAKPTHCEFDGGDYNFELDIQGLSSQQAKDFLEYLQSMCGKENVSVDMFVGLELSTVENRYSFSIKMESFEKILRPLFLNEVHKQYDHRTDLITRYQDMSSYHILTSELSDFFLQYLISMEKSNVWENSFLSLTGLDILPTYCRYGQSRLPNRMFFQFTELKPEQAEHVKQFLLEHCGPTVEMTADMTPCGKPFHQFDFDTEKFFNLVAIDLMTHFDEEIAEKKPALMEAYQAHTKDDYRVKVQKKIYNLLDKINNIEKLCEFTDSSQSKLALWLEKLSSTLVTYIDYHEIGLANAELENFTSQLMHIYYKLKVPFPDVEQLVEEIGAVQQVCGKYDNNSLLAKQMRELKAGLLNHITVDQVPGTTNVFNQFAEALDGLKRDIDHLVDELSPVHCILIDPTSPVIKEIAAIRTQQAQEEKKPAEPSLAQSALSLFYRGMNAVYSMALQPPNLTEVPEAGEAEKHSRRPG